MSACAKEQAGFSTVELLISLFITAAFIATGFQLFSAVTANSHEARMRATAHNLATEGVQRLKESVSLPCSPLGPISATLPPSSLPQANSQFEVTCPYGDGAGTARITHTVTYGDPQRTVKASIDVSR